MDKTYRFTISAECVVEGEDGTKMFDSNVVYHSMKYEDVVLVEKHLLTALQSLNQFAENKGKPAKK